MANDKKSAELAPGFDEVPLSEGFEEVPLTAEEPSMYQKFMDYTKGARDYASESAQTAQDAAQGAGKSLLSTQIVPAMNATIASATGAAPELSWAQKYRQLQDDLQQQQKASQERSPTAFGSGEIGGMVLPALVSGGATAAARGVAPSLLERAAVGTLTGGAMAASTSEKGHLIDSTPEERNALLKDTASGVVTGGILGGTLSTAAPLIAKGAKNIKEKVSSNLGKYLSDSPLWSQIKKAEELGSKGKNIYSEEAIQGPIGETSGLIHQDTNAAKDLVDRMYKVDSNLGKKVGESIDNATGSGITVDLSEPMLNSVNTFKTLIEKDQNLAANPKAKKLYDTIFQMADDEGGFNASNLTPKEVQTLRQDVSEFADSIKLKNPDVAGLGFEFQGQIGDLLKNAVPEYKIAAERFEQFRRLVPETVISGSTPVEISNVKLGNLKNDEAKLFQSTKNMIQGARMPGSGVNTSKETFKNLINGVNEFEQSEAQRLASGQIAANEEMPKLVDMANESQASGLQKQIKDRADNSALLQQAWRVNPQESAATSIKGAMFGRGSVVNMANKYGLYKDTLSKPVTAPAKLASNIYKASEEQLKQLAQHMSEIPGLQSVGKALMAGLENKDVSGVNAAIFSIMQNPQARILVNGNEDINSNENEKK